MASAVVSFLVVNFNGIRFVDDCIASIKRCVSVHFEVVFVDNASSDGSAEYVQQHYPWVKLVRSEINLGFTGGNNLGSEYVTAKYVVLLNNDTIVKTDVVSLIDDFEKDETLGVVGCKLVYGDGSFQPSFGFDHNPMRLLLFWVGLGDLFKRWPLVMISETREELYKNHQPRVDWVCGAFLATRVDLWRRLGGLDVEYFMYVEDVDYCRRARIAGYSVLYDPATEITHFGGGGRAWAGERALLNTVKSYRIYVRKFYGDFSAKLFLPFLASAFIVRSFAYSMAFVFSGFRGVYGEKALGFLRAVKSMSVRG